MLGDRQHRPGDSAGRWSQTRVGFPRLLALGLETRERRGEEKRGEERRAFACVKFVMLMSIVENVLFAVQVNVYLVCTHVSLQRGALHYVCVCG